MSFPVGNAACRCGRVELPVSGRPIVARRCRCSSCRDAGRRLEALPDAPPFLDADEGTPFVLFRKDRVTCTKGSELLREVRLNTTSPTRRVIATCCNSDMFLDFTRGHWVSLLRDRLDDGQPGRADAVAAPPTGMFGSRLLLAWAAMGFRSPPDRLRARRIRRCLTTT